MSYTPNYSSEAYSSDISLFKGGDPIYQDNGDFKDLNGTKNFMDSWGDGTNKETRAQLISAYMSAQGQVTASQVEAEAMAYAAKTEADAAVNSAMVQADATKYAADMDYAAIQEQVRGDLEIAKIEAETADKDREVEFAKVEVDMANATANQTTANAAIISSNAEVIEAEGELEEAKNKDGGDSVFA